MNENAIRVRLEKVANQLERRALPDELSTVEAAREIVFAISRGYRTGATEDEQRTALELITPLLPHLVRLKDEREAREHEDEIRERMERESRELSIDLGDYVGRYTPPDPELETINQASDDGEINNEEGKGY